jgi:hypothetical protein
VINDVEMNGYFFFRVHFCDRWLFRNYGSKMLVVEEPLTLTPIQCKEILTRRRLKIVHEELAVEFDVNPSGSTSHVFWAIGSLDNLGWCSPQSFTSEGFLWRDAMLEVTFNLLVRKIPSVVVEGHSGTPTLALTSGGDTVSAQFNLGSLVDRNLGTCIWNLDDNEGKNCSRGLYSLILHDMARVSTSN